jgi:hypothetical protein
VCSILIVHGSSFSLSEASCLDWQHDDDYVATAKIIKAVGAAPGMVTTQPELVKTVDDQPELLVRTV